MRVCIIAIGMIPFPKVLNSHWAEGAMMKVTGMQQNSPSPSARRNSSIFDTRGKNKTLWPHPPPFQDPSGESTTPQWHKAGGDKSAHTHIHRQSILIIHQSCFYTTVNWDFVQLIITEVHPHANLVEVLFLLNRSPYLPSTNIIINSKAWHWKDAEIQLTMPLRKVVLLWSLWFGPEKSHQKMC